MSVSDFHFPETQLLLISVQHVQSFLLQVSGDRLATALFQLAICGGSLAAPQDLVLKEKTAKTSDQAKKDDKSTTSLPSEGISAGCTVALCSRLIPHLDV